MTATAVAIETPQVARLPGGDLPYTLRRSPRARRLRVVIHPERGVVVTLPPTTRRGWARADGLIVEVHPQPEKAVSDGAQSLTLPGFRQMMRELQPYMRLWEEARSAAAVTVA